MENYQLINFLDLVREELEMVLKWRNSIEVKKWMYNQNEIEIEDHLTFVNSLNNNSSKLYFVLKNDENYLGVIDFTEINEDSCYYGFYSNPDCNMKGIGRILEKMSLDYAFDILKVRKLKLEVFKENSQVKNLHKKNGFDVVSEKMVGEKEVLCMELNYENSK